MAGRSNVGKSSLINALVGRKSLARVSGTPGKTREINFYRIDNRFFLVDLPGYGFARAPEQLRDAWQALMADYLVRNERLEGLVLLLDARRGVMEVDRQLLEYVAGTQIPVLLVLTKIDKLNRSGRARALLDIRRELGLPADQVLATSARTGEGVTTLVESLYDLVETRSGGDA